MSELENKITILKELYEELEKYDQFQDSLIKNETELNYTKLMEEISPNERMDLNWNVGYSTYTLYYCKRTKLNI